VRWARLRRATFPLHFAPEIVTTSLLTLAAAAIGGEELGVSAPAALILAAAIWYGAEASLAAVARWPLAWSSPAAWMARDALLPVLWLSGWMNARFVWRGNVMSADEETLVAEGGSGGAGG
jgi:ceramide glucosyltransferase